MNVQLIVRNVYTTIVVDDRKREKEVIDLLSQYLRYENSFWARQRNQWMKKYAYVIYTDRKTKLRKTYTGLLDIVVGVLKHFGIPYEINDQTTPVEVPDPDLMCRRLDRLGLSPRPYQEEAIFKGIENRRGMFNLCTGAGKTLVMAGLASLWHQKTLVVCDSTDLAYQLQEELSDLLHEGVGMIGAGEFDPERVTVGMVSTLTSKQAGKRKKQAMKEYLASVTHLMFDEVHHSQAKTWQQVAKMCTGASLRHGFSGTCFTPEEELEDGRKKNTRDLLLLAHTGRIVYSMKTAQLVEMGYLSKPTVYMVRYLMPNYGQSMDYADEYTRMIAEDVGRNNLISKITKREYEDGEQTIVFVERIEHGHNLVDMMCDEYEIPNNDAEFVKGESQRTTRKKLISDFKHKRLPVLVGTVLGEGLNFFAKAGINTAAGKSKKNIIQRIGRVLRKDIDPEIGDVNTEEVRHVKYFDFLDLNHPIFSKQAQERLRIYQDEGHDVKIITIQDDKVVDSGIETIPLKGDNLKAMYAVLVDTYQGYVGRFKWKRGEKGRVKPAFMFFCEAQNIRKASDFELALDQWREYLVDCTKEWLEWDEGNRENYIGYVTSRKRLEVYTAQQRHGDAAVDDLTIAGTEDKSEWEF